MVSAGVTVYCPPKYCICTCVVDMLQSDSENSDVFQESYQHFSSTSPSSSDVVAGSSTENDHLPGGGRSRSGEMVSSHKAFITPRESVTSPPCVLPPNSPRPSEYGRLLHSISITGQSLFFVAF